jgi:hypothetical protein
MSFSMIVMGSLVLAACFLNRRQRRSKSNPGNQLIARILAICAGCGQIREEDGAWMPAADGEGGEHSRARSKLCPDCARKLYVANGLLGYPKV